MRFSTFRNLGFGCPSIAVAIWLLFSHVNALAYVYPVHLDQKPRGTAVELTLVNDGPAFINVIVELLSTSNTGFSPAVIGSKYPHQLKPGESKLISLAVPLKVGKQAIFSYKLKYAFGDPDAQVKSQFVYRLPFLENHRGVIRPYTGAYLSNYLVDTANAVEFLLPLNTPIVAARDGIVINARGQRGLKDSETATSVGNFVSVMHDDGSWGTYGWLADDSVLVKPGDAVKAGQQIALSGTNPDSYEDYIFFVVNKNFWALQLKSVPIKLSMYNGEVFDVLSYSGPVSPNLSPKYIVPLKTETPWSPPESLIPLPKLPVDWNDEHLNPTQRAVLFRQRMNAAAEAAGTDSVSGSQPLLFLAMAAIFLGTVGAFAALASHSSRKPSGMRGIFWSLFRGQTPTGPFRSTSGATGSEGAGRTSENQSNEPLVRLPESSLTIEPSLASDTSVSAVELTQSPDEAEEVSHVKPLMGHDQLQLLTLIHKALPAGVICTAQLPLSNVIDSELSEPLRLAQIDFVLFDVSTGRPVAAILFAQDPGNQLSMQISQRLSLAGVATTSFDKIPRLGELKARLKRLVV